MGCPRRTAHPTLPLVFWAMVVTAVDRSAKGLRPRPKSWEIERLKIVLAKLQ